ncbi:hypothetical protein BP6252_12691 [Coleophoma cylindrospora]|uniref:Uncharacterized protein n=1 Tax=Coleophoma cylindrospora TaxID=1849047 RepID=A0A3D8QDU6_9HELO|nr:hypothetical protein BP6252_12691 [Coleophoma cylindrospora]
MPTKQEVRHRDESDILTPRPRRLGLINNYAQRMDQFYLDMEQQREDSLMQLYRMQNQGLRRRAQDGQKLQQFVQVADMMAYSNAGPPSQNIFPSLGPQVSYNHPQVCAMQKMAPVNNYQYLPPQQPYPAPPNQPDQPAYHYPPYNTPSYLSEEPPPYVQAGFTYQEMYSRQGDCTTVGDSISQLSRFKTDQEIKKYYPPYLQPSLAFQQTPNFYPPPAPQFHPAFQSPPVSYPPALNPRPGYGVQVRNPQQQWDNSMVDYANPLHFTTPAVATEQQPPIVLAPPRERQAEPAKPQPGAQAITDSPQSPINLVSPEPQPAQIRQESTIRVQLPEASVQSLALQTEQVLTPDLTAAGVELGPWNPESDSKDFEAFLKSMDLPTFEEYLLPQLTEENEKMPWPEGREPEV